MFLGLDFVRAEWRLALDSPCSCCILASFVVTLLRPREHLLSVFLYISVLGRVALHVHFFLGLRLFTQSVVHVYSKYRSHSEHCLSA